MRQIRRILFAVKDPDSPGMPRALLKAAQLAAGLDARLELFHALTWPVYANSRLEFEQLGAIEQRRILQRLQRLAARLRSSRRYRHLHIAVAATWDRPAYEAVIRRAVALRADLIIIDRHAGRRLAPPALLHFNDWELLRQSPVPVLIVKRGGAYRRPTLLAAVDPAHSMDKPAQLDARILDLGRMIGHALAGRLHAVHACQMVPVWPLPTYPSGVEAATRMNDEIVAAVKRRYARLLDRYALPRSHRHLVNLPPAEAIEAVASRLRCQIVVLGALSRAGWQRLLIGNTAEAVLDPLPCDLLIVKPSGFRTPVARAASGARYVPVANLMVA